MLHFFAEYLWIWLVVGCSLLIVALLHDARIDAYQAEMDYPGRLKVTLMLGSVVLIYLSAIATILGLIGKIFAA